MKKTPLRRVSKKKQKDLALQTEIREESIAEGNGALCMTCGKPPDWRGLSFSHKIALGRGGKTTRENCIPFECMICHDKFEKKDELRQEFIRKTACLYPGWIQEWEKEE